MGWIIVSTLQANYEDQIRSYKSIFTIKHSLRND